MGRTTKQYKEIEQVKETIQKYIDGANGDLKVLKEAYNEKALINGAPIEALFRSVEHYGETHATARIDYLDISGIAGVAKVGDNIPDKVLDYLRDKFNIPLSGDELRQGHPDHIQEFVIVGVAAAGLQILGEVERNAFVAEAGREARIA